MIPCALLLAIASSVAPQDDAERTAREREHDAAQRRIQLRLFDVDFKETPLDDVFDFLLKRGVEIVRTDWRSGWVTFSRKDATLRQILDEIEDQVDLTIFDFEGRVTVRHKKRPRNVRAYLPCVTLDFATRRVKQWGEDLGVVITARNLGPAVPHQVEWEILDSENRRIPLESCDTCGPLVIYADSKAKFLRIGLKGRVRWNSVYSFEIANPAEPQSFRVGEYAIRYEFPRAEITSEREIPYSEFADGRLVGASRVPRRPWKSSMGVCGTVPSPSGKCNCIKSQVVPPWKPPLTCRNRTVGGLYGSEMNPKPSDFVSVRLSLNKPMLEAFETEVSVRVEESVRHGFGR